MIKLNGDHLQFDFEDRVTIPYARGKQAFVLAGGRLLDEAKQLFGREGMNLCLKIFIVPMEGEFENYDWGRPWRHYIRDRCREIGYLSTLEEASLVQNILWLEGYAPRVYGHLLIEKGGKLYPAQLADYLEGSSDRSQIWVHERRLMLEALLVKYGCLPCHKDLISSKDFIDDKLIDLQGFRTAKKTGEAIVKLLREGGKYGKAIYQSVKELGIGAHPRDTEARIRQMHLDTVDFRGKTVLDVGCNVGMLCNYASRAGAKRVIGIDQTGEMVRSAYLIAFYLGQHNNDYYAYDLLQEKMPDCVTAQNDTTPPWCQEIDITFFLSMNLHVGVPEWMLEKTKELLIFEENAKSSKFKTDYWLNYLSKSFGDVKVVGHTKDHNPKFPKPIIFARKELKNENIRNDERI